MHECFAIFTTKRERLNELETSCIDFGVFSSLVITGNYSERRVPHNSENSFYISSLGEAIHNGQ